MRRERIEVLCKKEVCYFFWKGNVYEIPASKCKEAVSLIRREIDKYRQCIRNIVEEAARLIMEHGSLLRYRNKQFTR